jgi:uncharacterized phage protein gp47/JayE
LSTAVPPIQWTTGGVILPTDAAILTGVQTDIDNAFGGGVNPALNTPQGQLASSEAAIIAEKNSEIAYIVNQVDPQYAEGRFQDAIGRIYFMTRMPAEPTVVTCMLGGVSGTFIAAGTLALDTSGNTYQLLDAVTIGGGGTVSAQFANLKTGPIPCAPSTLTQIYQAISGWDTITNPASGVLGDNVESSQAFELRRQNSVAKNGNGFTAAIFANVYAVPGVLNCYVVDNPLGTVQPVGATNYPLAPHSIYVAVVGGSSAAIAAAIWLAKNGGCGYNGNTTVNYTPTGYTASPPTYPVTFNIPTPTPIFFAVTVSAALPSGVATLIQNAIIAQFNGQNNNTPAGIASLILASSYYAAVLSVLLANAPGVALVSILIGFSASPTGFEVQMGIDQSPTLTSGDIAVIT